MTDVDALLNLYGQVEQTDPRTPDEPVSDDSLKSFYDTEMAGPLGKALPKATGDAMADPEKAGAALKLSKESGVPATVVAADPVSAKNDWKSATAVKYVRDNPYIQDYINSFPLASQVSNDDWENMHYVGDLASASMGVVPGDIKFMMKESELTQALIVTPIRMLASIGELAKQLGGAYSNPDPEAHEQAERLGLPLMAAMLVAGGRTFPKAREPLSSSAEINDFLRSSGHGPIESPGLKTRREIDEFLARKAQEELGEPKLLERPKEAPPELTPAAEGIIKAGEMPPPRTDPVVDKFHVAQAGRDLEAFDKTFEMIQKTKTKERSPEAMESYLTKVFGTRTLSIPVEAVDKLYGVETPVAGDEKLGYEPGVDEKLKLAKESGTDVQIPMARFLAHTSEPVYTAIKNDLRLKEEGVTKEEGKEVKEEEPELVASAAVMVEGKIYTGILHSDAIEAAAKDFGMDTVKFSTPAGPRPLHQGFVTSTGRFVTREEAAAIANSQKQVTPGREEFVKKELSADFLETHPDLDYAKVFKSVDAQNAAIAKDAAKKSFYFQPLFQNAKAANMTEGEFARYFNKIQKSDEADFQKIFDREETKAKQRMSVKWNLEEAETRSEVETDLRSRPDMVADRFFNYGEMPSGAKVPKVKMLRSAAERSGASTEVMKKYTSEDGEHPDLLAGTLDFTSGKELIQSLNDLSQARAGKGPKEYFNQLVKDETQARMERKYDAPSIILEEAREAALAEHHIDILADELRALAKADGKEAPYTRAELEAYIKAKFKTRKANEVGFETFRRSADKHGRAAEKALITGKFDEAFQAKQRQMLSILEAKEARAFAKRDKQAKNLYGRYQDNRVLKNVDQTYVNHAHNIFKMVGISHPRNPEELVSALEGKTLVDFLHDKREMGRVLEVDDQLINSGKKVDDYTVQEADNLHESIQSINHNGREEKFLQVGAQKLDHEIAVQRAEVQLAKNKDQFRPRRPGTIAKLKSTVYDWDAMLIKAEQLFDWADNSDPLGVFNETVYRGLAEGKHLENDMRKELGQMLKALPSSRKFVRSLNDKIDNKLLIDWQTGEPMSMTGQDLLGMMFYMGHRTGFEKLTAKFKYNGKEFQFDPMAVKGLVKQNATEDHWKYVQGVWDIYEHFWPRAEKVARNTSGVAPDKIEAIPIKTEWGTFRGGYYPLRADANWVGPRTGASGIFGADRYFRAIPAKSWEHARTGAVYPVDLNYSAVIPMMEGFIHDLAFREPLMNAVKFLEDTRIKQGIARAFGPEYLNQIRPWLEYVATSKRVNDQALSGLNSMARWTRERLVAVQLLYRASTIIKHSIAASLDSFGESGLYKNKAEYAKDFSANTMRLYGTPDGHRIISEIFQKSGEIRNRMHDMDRDIGESLDRSLGQSGMMATATHFGGYGVAMLDLGSAIPTWYTHYKRALAEGYEEMDARTIGDKVVRQAHGSAGVTDLPAIQRGSEVTRLFTVAYSFFNHSYNRVRMIGRETRQGLDDLRAGRTADAFDKFMSASWRSLWYIVLLGAVEEWVQPIPTKDGSHEGVGMFLAKGIAYQLSGTLPFIRDFGRAALYGRTDVAATPISSIYAAVVGGLSDFTKQASGQRVKQNALRGQIEAAGYALKIPGAGQAAATSQYIWDLRRHLQRAENPYRMVRGLLMGRSHPEEKRRR